METNATPLDPPLQQLGSQWAQVIGNNRAKLQSITATISFSGKHAISLRDYRDDWSDLLESEESHKQGGNFHARYRDAVGIPVKKCLKPDAIPTIFPKWIHGELTFYLYTMLSRKGMIKVQCGYIYIYTYSCSYMMHMIVYYRNDDHILMSPRKISTINRNPVRPAGCTTSHTIFKVTRKRRSSGK